jgi:hypothetical protein
MEMSQLEMEIPANDLERLRHSFRPKRITTLFLGESAPLAVAVWTPSTQLQLKASEAFAFFRYGHTGVMNVASHKI